MKFVRYLVQGQEELGVFSKDEKGVINLTSLCLSKAYFDMIDVIKNLTESDLSIIQQAMEKETTVVPLEQVKLCAPIAKPIHDMICVGVNYSDHLAETQKSFDHDFQEPAASVYFAKRVVKPIGPDEEIESHSEVDPCLDYEVELGVIIGRTGVNIPKEEAEDYIFGYTIVNDISARTLQKKHVQWYRGKSLDSFTAMGPVILHKKDMPFPVEVDLCSKVNGEIRQQSNTKYYLADIPSLIADLSKGMTLEAGDIIATGTPAGVGMGFNPPRYMKSGDVVECEVEKIGVLKNTVK